MSAPLVRRWDVLRRTAAALLAMTLFIAACGADSTGDGADPTITDPPVTTPAPDTTAPSDAGEPVTDSTPPSSEPPGSGDTTPPTGNVAFAIADLAELIGVDPADIVVVSQEDVTWRDGSLGCPQPGMMYTQALVDGYKIILEVDGVQYPYHGKGTQEPFLCTNDLPIDTPTPTFLEPKEEDAEETGSLDY